MPRTARSTSASPRTSPRGSPSTATGRGSDFCREHGLIRLVHAEPHSDIRDAIVREKAMKKWKRQWKLRLICQHNPDWRDLHEDILGTTF